MTTRSEILEQLALAVVMAILITACAPQRSVEAFCDSYDTETARLTDKYEQRFENLDEGEPLAGLLMATGSLAEGMGDAVVLFDKLESVAPDDIRYEVAAVRDAVQDQVDAMGSAASDPWAALGAGLMSGFSVQGSADAVDRYIRDNCTP
jgi:hypothetical protein